MTRKRARTSIPRFTKPISLLLLTIVLGTPHIRCAGAEVRVEGEPEAVHVEALDASVQEVLIALGTSFGLQYRGAAPLDRRITGTYRESLQHVVRRLLDGYDFVLKTHLDKVEVMVLGRGRPEQASAAPTPVVVPAIAPTPTRAQTATERSRQRRKAR